MVTKYLPAPESESAASSAETSVGKNSSSSPSTPTTSGGRSATPCIDYLAIATEVASAGNPTRALARWPQEDWLPVLHASLGAREGSSVNGLAGRVDGWLLDGENVPLYDTDKQPAIDIINSQLETTWAAYELGSRDETTQFLRSHLRPTITALLAHSALIIQCPDRGC